MINADPGAYGSSWFAATQVASPHRAPLAVELDVDVCVIGAGLAGLTVAREVARRGWSVVVLEAQSVAWNASGRNTGFVLPGFAAVRRRAGRRASASNTPGRCGRCRRRAPNTCARGRARRQMPGVESQRRRLAACRRRPTAAARCRPSRAAGRRSSAPRSRSGRPNGARGAALAALFRRAALSARLQHPSAQLRARPRRRGRSATARASTRTRRRWRSIRPACASASSPATRACARAMSCSPATSISPT